jgi:DHA2 family multidrug resistance protein-like MFS transporter
MTVEEQQTGLAPGRRALAIATIVCGLTMSVLDGSIANIALPSIARDMHATSAQSIWIINSYQIALAVCLLPLASLGEIIGYRRIYLCGLVLFTLASLACGNSASIAQLSVARVLQGFGAAGIMSVNTALIRFIYPARMLGRAISYNALVAGTASALGPTIAGLILGVASWHWLFLINVPLGVLTLMIGWRSLPLTHRSRRRYDVASALLCIAFIGSLLYVIDAIGHLQGAFEIGAGIAFTAVAAIALLRLQSPLAPMLPIDLLSIPLFGLSIGTSFCSFAAQAVAVLILPFYLQDTLRQGATHAGLLLTAWPAAVALTAIVAGRLADRVSAGALGGIGLAILTIGLLSLLTIGAASADSWIVVRLLICGFGFGLFQSPNNRAMISAAPHARSGSASGMLATGRLTGQTAGASLVAFALGGTAAPFGFSCCAAAFLAGAACWISLRRIGLAAANPPGKCMRP